MPRVPIADLKRDDPEVQRVASRVLVHRSGDVIGGQVPNLFGVLLQRPNIAEAFLNFGTELRQRGVLSDRIRELAIMHVACLNRVAHLWHAHYRHALAAGIAEDLLRRLVEQDPGAHTGFDAKDRAVLAYAAAATRDIAVPDGVFRELARHLSGPEIVELTALVAFYNLVSRLILPLAVEDDEGRPASVPPFDDPLAA